MNLSKLEGPASCQSPLHRICSSGVELALKAFWLCAKVTVFEVTATISQSEVA